MEEKLLLTEPDAMRILSLSRSTLRRFWADGRLVPLKVGRSIRYTPEDITAFVESLRRENGVS